MRGHSGIYVEIRVQGPMEEVWGRTQNPEPHRRWDLRFTEIRDLPRPDESRPQRFLYATRIGFGLRIEGEGESTGPRDGPGGERTSALRFRSDDPKSLIREGGGSWRYVPTDDGVRFLTWYDYRPRFGLLGRALDAAAFRRTNWPCSPTPACRPSGSARRSCCWARRKSSGDSCC